MKIALGIEYIGTNFHGWQKQSGLHTVQSRVEDALSKVADMPIQVQCAGRTDVGVHALGQVVHFETTKNRDLRAWVFGSNCYLPHDIRIQWAQDVHDDFHARFSAFSRHYRYFIYNHQVPSAIFHNRMTFHPVELGDKSMHDAAQCLIGEHDFSSFRSIHCQSLSAMRNVTKIAVKRSGKVITIDIVANAFLHHMVRNIVGTLLEIGMKKRPPCWTKEVLDEKDRCLAGATASASGLYFLSVEYPKEHLLPIKTNMKIDIFE